VRQGLASLLAKYKITSMMDTSCGSMLWMPLVLRAHQASTPGFKFYGSDVVCSLIERHKETFKNESGWSFGCNDYGGQSARGESAGRARVRARRKQAGPLNAAQLRRAWWPWGVGQAWARCRRRGGVAGWVDSR
jgi:hypothetical protein